jgi:hypothetical protein
MAKTWLKVIGVSCYRQVSLLSIFGICKSRNRSIGPCRISLAECSCSGFTLLISCVHVIPLSLFRWCRWRLSVGGPDSWWLDTVLGPILGVGCWWRTSPLGRGVCPCNCRQNASAQNSIFWNCFRYSILQIMNLNYNNLTITSLIVSKCLLCVFVHSRFVIPWSILRWWTPHFWGGSVTVGIRARSGWNMHSKH